MPGERRFEQGVELDAPLDVVHAFLGDLHRHRGLHPLIERIDDLPSTPERPAARRYRITDRLPLGPFRFRSVYVAEIEDVSPSEIHGRAWQSPGVEVETVYRLDPTATGGTHLRESCVLRAPRLLLGYAARQAEKAHRETFAKLGAAIAAAQT